MKAPKSVTDLVGRSSRATCAIMEREITVKSENVATTKSRLSAAGFMIIGTSEPGGRTRKVWFIRRGGF